jgi:uncharacterized protein with HEPN domain
MGDGKMRLEAKIKSNYLNDILDGSKTMEFRQFDGSDTLILTDETGRKVKCQIESVMEAGAAFEKTIRENHQDVKWKNDTEGKMPIIVMHIKPLEVM